MHHPVVAADRVVVVPLEVDLRRHRRGEPLERLPIAPVGDGDVLRLESERPAVRAVQVEDAVVEERGVDGRIEGQIGIADVVVELADRVGAERRHRPRGVELLGHVRHESLVAGDDHFGRPAPRRDAEQLELDGQQIRLAFGALYVGVDAVDERRNDRLAPLVVVPQLGREVAPEAEQAGAGVALQLAGAEHLGDRSGRAAAPDLELEEPVAGGRVALREEQVVLVLGVDVGDPPAVGHDLDRCDQSGRSERLLLRRLRADVRPGRRHRHRRERHHDPDGISEYHSSTPHPTRSSVIIGAPGRST